MVQAVDNRTDIAGRIQAVRADPARPGYRIVTLEIHDATPVQGYANMFNAAQGSRLDVVVPDSQAQGMAPGKGVRCRIRRHDPVTVFGDSCTTE